MIKKTVWFCAAVLALTLNAAAAPPEGFLRADGTRIVDGQGREVLLRGMGLGGWMLQEGYMLGINKEGTQHSIKARITDLVGKTDAEEFYRLWRQNHMTKADVDRLAASGFNSIRLPMHYNLFTLPIEEEPVKGRDTWLRTGFEMTDSLLAWCRANRIYLILDLHAAPGGQGRDANISDYDPARPSLWESEENRRKTVALWRRLAQRYANESWIGGYDILNEPNWTFEGKDKNGREDVSNQPIWDLYKAITKAIREVDSKHIVIVEGNGWGNNYSGLPEAWDRNLVMSFHKYWNPNTEEAIAKFLALREKYRMPLWLGESGENTNDWFRECVTLVEKHGIGWAWWPYKKLSNPRCIQTVTPPDDFRKIVAYWNGEGERPAREAARRGLFELVENLKIDRCRFNADVAQALIPPAGAGPAAAQAPAPPAGMVSEDRFLGIATFRLWEGGAPGAIGIADADIPTLTLFRPHGRTGNGTALVIAPGGAYLGLAANLEGRQVADWFTARGVTAFVLKYRLGKDYLYPTPLLDAQRAVRLVRSRAKEFGIAPDRIGMMGFSAGGHLTAATGTMFDPGKADAPDAVDRVSSRPDFLVLGYPWLNAMKRDQKGVISYCSVLKIEPDKCASYEQYSPDLHVSAQTPPTFLYHTTDDQTVPVDASVSFYRGLAAAGVPAEMHVFATGRHGSGLGLGDAALDNWPMLLEAWLRARGLLTPIPAPAATPSR